jgi:hypothetical protein
MGVEAPQGWPSAMGHLGATIPMLNRAIVFRAAADILTCREVPMSSNRGARVDTYNTRAGAPLGSYWCASWATAVYVDAGADVPPSERASCDRLVSWAHAEGLWRPKTETPVPGEMVLYTNGKALVGNTFPGQLDAYHVGIVAGTSPYLASIEGNSAFAGFSANGEAVLVKLIATSRVYGYLKPRPRSIP